MYRSICGRTLLMSFAVGVCASVHKAGVTSENMFHVDHAVRFPLPAKLDVVSEPVNA